MKQRIYSKKEVDTVSLASVVHVRLEKDIAVVSAEGYVNKDGGEKVLEECGRLLGEGVRRFVVNLDKCTMVNSVGVSILVEAIDSVAEEEGDLVFCCVPKHHFQIFEILGITQETEIFHTEEEALQNLSS